MKISPSGPARAKHAVHLHSCCHFKIMSIADSLVFCQAGSDTGWIGVRSHDVIEREVVSRTLKPLVPRWIEVLHGVLSGSGQIQKSRPGIVICGDNYGCNSENNLGFWTLIGTSATCTQRGASVVRTSRTPQMISSYHTKQTARVESSLS